ncbi:MAG TPA: histidine kinase [Sphingomicrobium sp.]|nr:histidine kinase [Sphingomicrobium sp.]
MGRGFHHPSGRVIALGRLLLATLFLLAILIDISQPAKAPAITYALLGAYVAFAAVLVVTTWNNWWLEARLAGPAHAIDVLVFVLLVFVTEGYTSPYFIFFVFVLLSAAIRWGWRETTLTAILLTLLYLGTALFASGKDVDFDGPRFIVRTAQLIIVSLILVWFGANQWHARFFIHSDELLSEPSLDKSPLETALAAAMKNVGAKQGALVWRDSERKNARAIAIRDGEKRDVKLKRRVLDGDGSSPFLYDMARQRGLRRDAERNLRPLDPIEAIGAETATAVRPREGLALPLELDKGDGLMFLEQVPNLSTDHIDLAEQIAADVSAHIQRHALLKAVEDNAEARSRLVLARDLHDSVVQFLAGAAFRLEAMKRSEAAGGSLQQDLNELKQLMMQEQGELRSFITALRSGPEVTLGDLTRDLRMLAERLSKQWAIDCTFSGEGGEAPIPTRVHLDAHQIVREAVANAVRHAGAKSVQIALDGGGEALRIDLVNDGAEYPRYGETYEPPQSLRERVEQSGGKVEIARGMDVTKLSISLPIRGGNGA